MLFKGLFAATNLKINWICAWRWLNSYFSPSMGRAVRSEVFPAHCRQELRPAAPCLSFGSKISSKRSKRDVSLLPPAFFTLVETPRWPALRLCPSSEFSKSAFQTALADFSIRSVPPGSYWNDIFFRWTMKNRWISSDVALLLCPVFISPVTQFSLSLPFPGVLCFRGHDICVLVI